MGFFEHTLNKFGGIKEISHNLFNNYVDQVIILCVNQLIVGNQINKFILNPTIHFL
ncbi:hypothetical protein NEF87_001338 [Candidatus Lokiarchaeum ossiferum]|uniref:Uncharacterized protein n=1 Tax=Candidatus Lokiarchaeum ossiferum TaxID=2951803 RepID=A0ABY6HNG0_9ARCH|nr:hypothetical protein NEF87_001338 [Candidatus Lokiarchaeum sp. B-35]